MKFIFGYRLFVEIVPDLIFVPLLAYDLNFNRLGYGKGFYDKTLYKFRKVKVFSDNLEIAEKIVHSAIGEEVLIEKSTNTDANEDLLEISSYEFRILSNSTFSLFSHFLSQKGISVIPSNWFKNQETNSTLLKTSSRKNLLFKIEMK